ncbi:hypothetical protein DXG01_004299 [Tephrocybe rancida]|nr:hypothetical protein DXG01_004299 [Tephrocybe rancida]
MSPENRDAYSKLLNSHTNDGSGPLSGRARTHGFGIKFPVDEVKEQYIGTFHKASRIRHSCAPNVAYWFDIASFSIRLVALRSIKKGEELLTSYCDISIPTAERQAALKSYQIDCKCPICLDCTNTDVYLASFEKTWEAFSKPNQGVGACVWRQNVMSCIGLMEEKGWHCLKYYPRFLVLAEKLAIHEGDRQKFKNMYKAWHLDVMGLKLEDN